MKLHNSLGGRIEEFQPLSPACTGIYVCGPTIYGDSHLGHGKSYVSFDVLIRYLRFLGMKVRYVQNITDVGHLTDDADMGEDKIQRQAVIERLEPMELVEKYTRSYFDDMDALGNVRPDISPRASGHIPEQIELISKLLAKGHAYEAGGSVYFSVRSFPRYGALSGRKTDDLLSGVRVEVSQDKRDPLDFALWKKAEEGHILRWRSPWGWGYPGWHAECSAMAMRYLGDTIDIHGGGLENIFPHHESEIAQSECATGRPFARFWLHNNMVTVDGRKMGKSLGNFTTLKQIFSDFTPAVVRLYILRSHYRSPLDFSRDGLDSARSACERLVELGRRLGSPAAGPAPASERALDLCSALSAGVSSALDDDLNTPQAVAALFEFARGANSLLDSGAGPGDAAALATALGVHAVDVLGLPLGSAAASAGGDETPLLGALSEARSALRRNRLFADTDRMRDALSAAGYAVRDLSDGSSLIEKA